MKEADNTLLRPLTKTFGSISSYSTTIYIIILTLSISYNIGYLKQINPQIIDLIELSDYLHDSIHNIWFFLLGALIYFIGSLNLVKENISDEFSKIVMFGIFSFSISLYYFLDGIYSNKSWPVIKKLLEGNNGPSLTIYLYLTIISVSIIFISYLLVFKRKNYKEKTAILTSVIPILMFLIFVLLPYISGMAKGYIENNYLTEEDYNIVHSVNIHFISGDKILKDVYIIKKLNKGLIIRKFNDTPEGRDDFSFINWDNIMSIRYTKSNRLDHRAL